MTAQYIFQVGDIVDIDPIRYPGLPSRRVVAAIDARGGNPQAFVQIAYGDLRWYPMGSLLLIRRAADIPLKEKKPSVLQPPTPAPVPVTPPEEWRMRWDCEFRRACMLADLNGSLEREKRQLMIENCDLRRRLEHLETFGRRR